MWLEAEHSKHNHCRNNYGCAFHFSPLSPDDPANTLLPLARTMDLAFIVNDPSLARDPSTVIKSPTLRESRLQPWRASALGFPASQSHFWTTVPRSSFTST